MDGRDWFAKPFCTATGKPSALRQLRLVEDWSRFDLDALSDWPDEVAHELSRMRMFAPERLDAIRDQLVKRIGTMRRIREGKSLRRVRSDPKQGGSAGQIRQNIAEKPCPTRRGWQGRRD